MCVCIFLKKQKYALKFLFINNMYIQIHTHTQIFDIFKVEKNWFSACKPRMTLPDQIIVWHTEYNVDIRKEKRLKDSFGAI